jgi:hypothetical protein
MPWAVFSLLAARVDPNQTSNKSSTPALIKAILKVLIINHNKLRTDVNKQLVNKLNRLIGKCRNCKDVGG